MAETKTISELIESLGTVRDNLGVHSLAELPSIIGDTIDGVITIIDEIAIKVGIDTEAEEYAKLSIIDKLIMIKDKE